MAVVKPYIFQIVGYQNSGKTTLATKIIALLTARDFSIVTIKHHGHGGKPDMVVNKDSNQHISAGACASIVEGDGRLLLQADKPSWTLNEQIDVLRPFQPDIILIEGHKFENYPKVVILRTDKDHELLDQLTNIHAVLFWDKNVNELQDRFPSTPFFDILDEQSSKWICSFLINNCN